MKVCSKLVSSLSRGARTRVSVNANGSLLETVKRVKSREFQIRASSSSIFSRSRQPVATALPPFSMFSARFASMCWSCGDAVEGATKGDADSETKSFALFCESPKHEGARVLQMLRDQQCDYFDLFGISPSVFLFDEKELEKSFKALQKQNHPDLYANSKVRVLSGNVNVDEDGSGSGIGMDEQDVSASNSSFINEAYQIMRSPIERANYILEQYHSIHVLGEDSGTYKGDASLALEIFELREQLEELLEEKDTDTDSDIDRDEKSPHMQAMHSSMKQQSRALMFKFQMALDTEMQRLEEEQVLGKDALLGRERQERGGQGQVQSEAVEDMARAAVKLKYITKIIEELEERC